MAKPDNAKLVGAFVLGALVLLVAAVAVFGGGALFRRNTPAVVYFQGSVAGLSVGAPVTFQGVTIGSVSRIVLEMSATTGEARIPVYIEFNSDAITFNRSEPALIRSFARCRNSSGPFATPAWNRSLPSGSLYPGTNRSPPPCGIVRYGPLACMRGPIVLPRLMASRNA